MKKLLALIMLCALPNAAFALEPEGGFYINISGGYTPSILAVNSGVSEGGYVGYKFNPIIAVEGGYTSLLSQASSGTNSVDSISGSEIAGILRFPINNRVSPFLRAGFARMTMKEATNGSDTSIEIIYGPTYGGGLQFYETDHVSLRVGYNIYNLQTSNDYNVQAGTPVNTSNAYISLLILF